MLNGCLEMKLIHYGFVGLLILVPTMVIMHPASIQVFAQGTNSTNATGTEVPSFDGSNPLFVPKSEDGVAPPPPPSDAVKVQDLPKEKPIKDPDSDPLSITNRTEILQILPANATKIIKHVDEDLKNSTGIGLAPADVLENITSEKSNDNKTLLQLASPQDIKKIESVDSVVANSTGGQEDEDEPVANATSQKALEGVQANFASNNATNATSGETPSQTRENQKQTEGEKEQAKTGAEEQALAGTPEASNVTNATNATSGETPSQTRENQKQTEGEKEQAKTGAEEQALAGTPEASNVTNATSGEEQSKKGGESNTIVVGKQQKSEGGEEQANTVVVGKKHKSEGGEEQAKTGGETTTNTTNTSIEKPSNEIMNKENVTSLLNATNSRESKDNSKDKG
jgi:hypothetical protein